MELDYSKFVEQKDSKNAGKYVCGFDSDKEPKTVKALREESIKAGISVQEISRSVMRAFLSQGGYEIDHEPQEE